MFVALHHPGKPGAVQGKVHSNYDQIGIAETSTPADPESV